MIDALTFPWLILAVYLGLVGAMYLFYPPDDPGQ